MNNEQNVSMVMIGGSRFIDIYIKSPSILILVNNPGMFISHMELFTNFQQDDGLTFDNLKKLANEITITAQCGHTGVSTIQPSLLAGKISPNLKIGIGPMGMYQNKIELRVNSGKTFTETVNKTIGLNSDKKNIVCGLQLIESSSHHQHGLKDFGSVLSDNREAEGHAHHSPSHD